MNMKLEDLIFKILDSYLDCKISLEKEGEIVDFVRIKVISAGMKL